MPRASFEQLSAFVAVADHGSFSKAARVLRKDRSTLHHQVTDLEIDWGVTLFERDGRSPKITEEGAALLRSAKFIIYQMNALESATDNLALGEKTTLTICYDASFSAEAILLFDQQLRNTHTSTDVHWLQRNRDDAMALLSQGNADFALTINEGQVHPNTGLTFINLGYPAFDFYAHKDSSLAKLKSVSLAELQMHRQFMIEDMKNSTLGSQLAVSPHLSMVSDTDVLLLLLQREGYAVLPAHLVAQSEHSFQRLNVDFANREGRFGYVLLYPSIAVLNNLQKTLINTVEDWFKNID